MDCSSGNTPTFTVTVIHLDESGQEEDQTILQLSSSSSNTIDALEAAAALLKYNNNSSKLSNTEDETSNYDPEDDIAAISPIQDLHSTTDAEENDEEWDRFSILSDIGENENVTNYDWMNVHMNSCDIHEKFVNKIPTPLTTRDRLALWKLSDEWWELRFTNVKLKEQFTFDFKLGDPNELETSVHYYYEFKNVYVKEVSASVVRILRKMSKLWWKILYLNTKLSQPFHFTFRSARPQEREYLLNGDIVKQITN